MHCQYMISEKASNSRHLSEACIICIVNIWYQKKLQIQDIFLRHVSYALSIYGIRKKLKFKTSFRGAYHMHCHCQKFKTFHQIYFYKHWKIFPVPKSKYTQTLGYNNIRACLIHTLVLFKNLELS